MQKELKPIKVDLKGRDCEVIAKVNDNLAVHLAVKKVYGIDKSVLCLELWQIANTKHVVSIPLTEKAMKALRPLIYHDCGTESDPKHAKLEDNPSCIIIHY